MGVNVVVTSPTDKSKPGTSLTPEDRKAIIEEATNAAVQKVIAGLDIELKTEPIKGSRVGLKVSIKFDGREVTSALIPLTELSDI